jgi:fructokinase
MTKKKRDIVVGIGEMLWDCFADSRRPGGAPANVAFHAKQLGHEGIVCSRVGRDELGAELLEYLERRGMETRQVQKDVRWPTGYVTVDTSRPDEPSYVIHEDVAWDYLEFDESLESLMESASAVCFGTLAQRQANSRETIRRALEAATNAVIVYDVNLRQSWHQRNWIEDSLKASNIAKFNEEEVAVLSDMIGTGGQRNADLAHTVIERFELEMVCITRAERGCSLYTSSRTVDETGVNIEVADAVGAGDAFTAALISSRLRGWPLDTTAWFANHVGALVASRQGAMPALTEELGRLIADVEKRLPNNSR